MGALGPPGEGRPSPEMESSGAGGGGSGPRPSHPPRTRNESILPLGSHEPKDGVKYHCSLLQGPLGEQPSLAVARADGLHGAALCCDLQMARFGA